MASHFDVDQVYLQHEYQTTMIDYRVGFLKFRTFQHLQVPLGRRFQALKIWFVLRSLGIEHFQQRVRHVRSPF